MILLVMVMVMTMVRMMMMTIDHGDDDSEPPPFSQIIWVGWLNARGKEVGRGRFCQFRFLTLFALAPLCSIFG